MKPGILYKSENEKPDLSIILLDWSCRESFHSLDYLNRQTISRDRYEIIWVEYYGRKARRIEEDIDRARAEARHPLVDQWIVMGIPERIYYHKHLMYNVGILACRGGIICICDSDAVFPPTFVESIVRTFMENDDIVLHLDEVANYSPRFYPFNYPSVDEIRGEGCVNWVADKGKTTGMLAAEDRIHLRNYGACMCARKDDVMAVGGADEHKDYLGHICGPYDLSFRLFNAGRKEVWHEDEYIYHVWHPGNAGRGNYLGPHDGKNMSSTALRALETGRIYPLEENPAVRAVRLGLQGERVQADLLVHAIREETINSWQIGYEQLQG